jgi:hypothetical protein
MLGNGILQRGGNRVWLVLGHAAELLLRLCNLGLLAVSLAVQLGHGLCELIHLEQHTYYLVRIAVLYHENLLGSKHN